MSVITVTKNNFDDEVMKSDKTVLVDFWASWCGPCKMLSPIIDQIGKEITKVKICKINIDDEPELAKTFKIMSIPTLVIIKNGNVVNTSVGVKTKSEILNMIESE